LKFLWILQVWIQNGNLNWIKQREKNKFYNWFMLHLQELTPPSLGSGPAHCGFLAHEPKQGVAPGFTGKQWPAKFRRVLAMRCSGEGSRRKLEGRRTGFGVVDRRRLTGWAGPRSSGSAAGKNDGKLEWRSSVWLERLERSSRAQRRLLRWHLARSGSVADGANDGKLTGAPEELPCLQDGAPARQRGEVLQGGPPVACLACHRCVAVVERVEQSCRTEHGVERRGERGKIDSALLLL
jgi:hypothetical protein